MRIYDYADNFQYIRTADITEEGNVFVKVQDDLVGGFEEVFISLEDIRLIVKALRERGEEI